MGYLIERPDFDISDDGNINVANLENPNDDRTLIYGYTLDRNSFHVFLKGGTIHKAIFNYEGNPVEAGYEAKDEWMACELAPSKRAYTESTDEGFARLMSASGVSISFLGFQPDTADKRAAKNDGFQARHNF